MCRTPWTLNFSDMLDLNLDWFLPFRERAPSFDKYAVLVAHLIRYTWEQGLASSAHWCSMQLPIARLSLHISDSYQRPRCLEHFCCPCQVDYPRCGLQESPTSVMPVYMDLVHLTPLTSSQIYGMPLTCFGHNWQARRRCHSKSSGSGWQRRNMTSTLIWHAREKRSFLSLDPSFHICWWWITLMLVWSHLHPWQSGCYTEAYQCWCVCGLQLLGLLDMVSGSTLSKELIQNAFEESIIFWILPWHQRRRWALTLTYCSRAFTVQDFSLAVSCLWLDDDQMFKQIC